MSDKDLQKTENTAATERIRNVKTFVPRVDIYETKDALFLIADMPGIDEQTVDVELEKNILTISGRVENGKVKDYRLVFSEYEVGDYERTFTLSDEIDRDKIKANVKHGVLRLELPKAEEVKPKKIKINAA
ncbi:MAG TPA: Hsp20/alpha crystallin family protein [Smithella sp.]|jgi:HSP20 family molecular chaperone IbpA|nr:MAG: Spore protein SP21 [Deltaproteobacteria bacterium ADurb.Bin022]HNQ65625.1 Hsp20/alpha crystallin family protein [Smithella sp.]HOE33026.1 Hsp20/alpha crystallin family protein [Smithella sp.]HOG10225.1 Hsp20/alpha crystallin family protein [Smithella sp.]HOO36069.1 Hsp20/alpha crystallin family protein [Smithella sp.]